MPRGLREEADAMSCETFLDQYAPSTGPCDWASGRAPTLTARHPAGPQARNYQATLAVGDRISTSSAQRRGRSPR